MPKHKQVHYPLSGLRWEKVYSQAEMAHALKIGEIELVNLLRSGEAGLCYHAHPNTTGSGYEFYEAAYTLNILRWQCHRAGGHKMVICNDDTYPVGGCEICQVCGHVEYDEFS